MPGLSDPVALHQRLSCGRASKAVLDRMTACLKARPDILDRRRENV
jgi:hypothetical protein